MINGPNSKKTIEGIKVKKSARYLGVEYNKTLDIKFSLDHMKTKINFLFIRFYKILKRANFRTNVNIWKVFVAPLIRMCYSLNGEWRGSEAIKNQ